MEMNESQEKEMSDIQKMELEYLRKEIDDSKQRSFKILLMMHSVPLVTAFLGISKNIDTPPFYHLFISIISSIFVFLYLSEKHTSHRAGNYIKINIEEKLGYQGWEGSLSHEREETRLLSSNTRNVIFLSVTLYVVCPVFIYIYHNCESSKGIAISVFFALVVVLCAIFKSYKNFNRLKKNR